MENTTITKTSYTQEWATRFQNLDQEIIDSVLTAMDGDLSQKLRLAESLSQCNQNWSDSAGGSFDNTIS